MIVIKTSQYLITHSMLQAYQFIWGDARDSDNTFQWLNIRLDFPEDPKYLPSVQWVSNLIKEVIWHHNYRTIFTTLE